MHYEKVTSGRFVVRENRFVARVVINNKEEKVHVKNTGRCREFLVPGAKVYLEDFEGRMGSRKYRYSLVAVDKVTDRGIIRINMDSQAPNHVVGEALESGVIRLPGMGELTAIKAEKTFGNSRFDFYVESEEKKAFVEVKGVTLENEGEALFPDAPTVRGVKHLNELVKALEEGYEAFAVFLIQMKGVKTFRPNEEMHPDFAKAMRECAEAGVQLLAFDSTVTEDGLAADSPVEIVLKKPCIP
ncbi:MAG: DNA/RNA nuclease SfsA [Clostridiales bacterium]|nr:DNA/RNA nuclease SfsA [Clostridiales bacterium]MDD7036027.1 DNA/RNA nuclease SfsA [Bacillota bacterium]MDY2920933.1 DNA/RNA nuclease SfsA [Lentihominibacter sp.]